MFTSKKMKITIYVMAALWVAVMAQVLVNQNMMDNGRIIEAFSNTNAKASKSKLKVAADYGTAFLSEQDKRNLIEHIAQDMGINEDYTITVKEDKKTASSMMRKESASAITEIKVVTTENPNDKTKKSHYIFVDLTLKKSMDSILTYKKIVETTLKKLNVKEQETTLTFMGEYLGDLTKEEKKQEIDRLLRTLQAKITIENRSEDLYTVYAYTRLIPEYMVSDGRKMNVNAAITYDENKDRTILYLATPILGEDY